MRIAVPLLFLSLLLLGCGGSGGGGSTATKTPVKLSILWDQRGRTVNAPSSALSCSLEVDGPGGTTLDSVINRPSGSELVLQEVTTADKITSGHVTFTLAFHADVDGSGDLVALAAGTAELKSDGTGIGTVTTFQTVSRVAVPANQSISEGETKDLVATAYDPRGAVVAVSPGSIFWSVSGGGDKISIQSDRAVGVKRGIGTVVATIDHIASQPSSVFVTFAPRAVEIPSLTGGANDLTFINALTPDGKVAVGLSRNATSVEAIRWTEAGGTVGLGMPPGATSTDAFGVSTDGNTIVGGGEGADGNGFAWMWSPSGGMQMLATPEGYVEAQANGVSGDGTIVVGFAKTAAGVSSSVKWENGGPPNIFFDGTAEAISRDGNLIVGESVHEDTDMQVAYGYTGVGYWTFYEGTGGGESTMSIASAVTPGGHTVVGGLSQGTNVWPMFWTPGTSTVRIEGTIVTRAYSVAADGTLIGGGAPEGGIAFLWTKEQGLLNFGRFLEAIGLLDDLNGLGPGTINGISDDKSTFAVSCYPAGGGEAAPRAFIIETPDFMDKS
jgi:hypothetical protein